MDRRTVIAVIATAIALPATAASRAGERISRVTTSINYLTLLPSSYKAKGAGVPLILFLHGSGERGKDLEKVKAWGAPAIAEKDPQFPFMVMSPQLPDGESWHALALKGLLDQVLVKYNVDRRRVYLTGLSLGKYGAWDLASRYPDYFAAVAPICGGGIAPAVGSMRAVPTWVFHGKMDDAVPEQESARMVTALQAAGGDVRYTVLPEGGHVDAWVHAYEKAGLFEWFMQHSRK